MKTLLGILTLTACGAAPRTSTPIAEPAHAPGTTTSMTVQPVFFYTDSHGKPVDAATPTSEPIQKVNPGGTPVPVLRPDGTAVTWGAFKRANGTAELACQDGRTNAKLTAHG